MPFMLPGIMGAAAAGGAGGGGFLAGLGNILKNPATLLGLGSLFGGDDDEQQKRTRYGRPGDIQHPDQSLYHAMSAILRLGGGLERMGPAKAPSSFVQAPPKPISVPGLGIQIGGGLGMDPALKDPSLLERGNTFNHFQPFQGLAQQMFDQASAAPRSAAPKRRRP